MNYWCVTETRRLWRVLAITAFVSCANLIVCAEGGILVVNVEDAHKRPVSEVQIGVDGDGGSAVTDDHGKARIRLAAQSKQKDWVFLHILKSPPGGDLVMVSPWDARTQVPSFENESENFVRVVLVERGDRVALESGNILAALTAKINQANAPKTTEKEKRQEDPKANLAAVAKQYGLDAEELDKAIRAWGAKTTDPYEAGLADLYQRNYPEASRKLSESLDLRKTDLAKAQSNVADAAFFLGQSLYLEGKYTDAAAAYQQAAHFKEEDGLILSNLGLSLTRAGAYATAEPILRHALAVYEKQLGQDDPRVALALTNIANLLRAKGDYPGAESLYRRALATTEKVLGRDHPMVATDLNNLAGLLEEAIGNYEEAEELYRRALAINEKALGPEDPVVAVNLTNLAMLLLRTKADYLSAEPLGRRALAIDQKVFGPDHPEIATDLNNLAAILRVKRDYMGAISLYRQALAIDERALGPDHPDVAGVMDNLAGLLEMTGDLATAEILCRRALAIDEKALGPNHPRVATKLNNLAWLLYKKGDYAGADPLYRRALSIDEKAFGPNHREVAIDLANLAELLYAKGDYTGAVQLSERALAIDEKTFGPDNPYTRAIREQLREFKEAIPRGVHVP